MGVGEVAAVSAFDVSDELDGLGIDEAVVVGILGDGGDDEVVGGAELAGDADDAIWRRRSDGEVDRLGAGTQVAREILDVRGVDRQDVIAGGGGGNQQAVDLEGGGRELDHTDVASKGDGVATEGEGEVGAVEGGRVDRLRRM